MAVTRTPQQEVETIGSLIDDTLSPLDHDTSAIDLRSTIDYMCSQFADILGETQWEAAPDKTIATLAAQQTFEETKALRERHLLADITVPAAQNFKILLAATELPAGQVKAIASTQNGLITAQHSGTFGTHNLSEVTGDNALSPKNLVLIFQGNTGDPILSGGRRVWGLLQHEAGATDGAAFTDSTPERAQVSFVRANATYDDLEACPVADIEGQVVNLCFIDRQDLSNWTEQDYLKRNTLVDFPGAAAVGVTLDAAIDNQGVTPATQSTDVFWRIDDASGLYFQTSDGARDILAVLPNVAGDELEVNADTFDLNVGAAGVIDFDNGMTVDSAGQPIAVGVVPGEISSSSLKLDATAGLAEVEGVGVTLDATTANLTANGVQGLLGFTDDSELIMTANDAAAKTLLVAARNTGAGVGNLELEADDDILFETIRETTPLPLDDAVAGPISGLTGGPHASVAAAIAYAINNGGISLAFNKFVLGANAAQGANIAGATLNLTTYTLDMDDVGFATNPIFIFHNGRLMVGADQAGDGDVYPGDTPASGDLKHDFPRPWRAGSVILSIAFN